MKKSTAAVIAVIIGILAGGAGMYLFGPGTEAPRGEVTTVKDKKVLYWRAPMDPTYIRDEPGKSPMGMDLVPVYEGGSAASAPGAVLIDPVTVQNMGVKTAPVRRRTLYKEIRTVGVVAYDEERVTHVHTKVDGWIEKLYVGSTGVGVKKDDILLEIYSPALVSAQEEHLLARKYGEGLTMAGRGSMPELTKRRLELWDVPPHQIMELEEKGTILRTLHIHSPSSGVVTDKPVVEGMYVKPGMRLYTIADLSRVWVYADVYEYELPWIKTGQEAEMTLASYPGVVFKGSVSFIYPYMEPRTRTNKVRIEFDNRDLRLKPDMYADVRLASVVARRTLAVPVEAVIMSGARSIVVVASGEGRFVPRPVVLGAEGEGFFEVKAGLNEGDIVVTSANFLIDSESRLKEAISKMLTGEEDDGQADGTQDHDMKNMEPMDHEGMQGHDMKNMEPMDHGGMQDHDISGHGMKQMESAPEEPRGMHSH